MASTTAFKIRERIESGKIHHDDIKHRDRLTDDEIARIPTDTVYMWVKTGQWKKKDFDKWLRVFACID